jgi:hypothetical protein
MERSSSLTLKQCLTRALRQGALRTLLMSKIDQRQKISINAKFRKKNSGSTLKKAVFRVFAYLFCAFLIWFGFDTLTSSPITLKDKLRGSGQIAAACVYLFMDIRILVIKNKRPNH